MADMRGILDDHVAKVAWRDGGPIVRCEGDGLEFGSMEEFGEHVDRLLAFPPRSRTEAVRDTWETRTSSVRGPSRSRSTTAGASGAAAAGPATARLTAGSGGGT